MADVPFATNLLGAIDPYIATAKGTDLSWIGNLPDSYWAGQNQAFKSRNQDLFQAGIPRDAAGNIDWNKASQMALAAGGIAAIPEAVSVGNLVGGQAIVDLNRRLNQQPGPPSLSSAGPSRSTEATQAEPPTQGTATLRQIAQARGLDVNALASQTRLDPDAPLNYDQRQILTPVLQQAVSGQSTQVAEAGTSAPATFASRFTGDTGGSTAPPPSGAMAGARPVQTVPQVPPQAIAQAPTQVAPGTRPPALPAQVQQIEAQIRYYEDLANKKSELATAAGQMQRPNEQKSLTDEADRAGKAAQSLRDSLQSMMAPTEAEKNVNNPAVAAGRRAEEIQKIRDAEAEAKNSGIQAQAAQYRDDLKPYTDLGMSILSDPRVYTGIGANAVLDINKVRAYFGDGRAAMMQEAVQKLQAASVLAQINTQRAQMQSAGEKSSRMFSSQIEQVEKASANMGNTIYGNRFLLNVQQHMGETAMEVARQAREYRAKYGTLDDGFDTQIEKYLEKHPVFSDLERARPDILGAPQVPPGAKGWSKEQAAAWGREHGLKAGEVARIGVGKYLTIPRIDVYRAQ